QQVGCALVTDLNSARADELNPRRQICRPAPQVGIDPNPGLLCGNKIGALGERLAYPALAGACLLNQTGARQRIQEAEQGSAIDEISLAHLIAATGAHQPYCLAAA